MATGLKLVVNNTAASNDSIVDPGKSWKKTVGAGVAFAGSGGFDLFNKTLKVVRYGVFYLLLWLRIPVSFLSSVFAGVGLIALGILAFVKPEFALLMKIAAFSFVSFLAGWLYDSLLIWISPEPMMIDGRPTDEMQQQ